MGDCAVRPHKRADCGDARPEKQMVEDQRRSATTVANAVAKPLDGARRTWTLWNIDLAHD